MHCHCLEIILAGNLMYILLPGRDVAGGMPIEGIRVYDAGRQTK